MIYDIDWSVNYIKIKISLSRWNENKVWKRVQSNHVGWFWFKIYIDWFVKNLRDSVLFIRFMVQQIAYNQTIFLILLNQ